MNILTRFKVAWFHDLSFAELTEVLTNAERYQDWNRLGFLSALVEHRWLTPMQTLTLRDQFKERYCRYYRHRAFTHTRLIAFLEYLDVEDRPAFPNFDNFGRRRNHNQHYWKQNDLYLQHAERLAATDGLLFRSLESVDRFFTAAYQRGIAKVRQGEIHAYPQGRSRNVLSDPYEVYFGEAAHNPFGTINARELREKYSYNKRNGAKYEPQKLPGYPVHQPYYRGTKAHKNLYKRLGNKRRRAEGKKLLEAGEEVL